MWRVSIVLSLRSFHLHYRAWGSVLSDSLLPLVYGETRSSETLPVEINGMDTRVGVSI